MHTQIHTASEGSTPSAEPAYQILEHPRASPALSSVDKEKKAERAGRSERDTHATAADIALTQAPVPSVWGAEIMHVLELGTPTIKTKDPEWDIRMAGGRDEVEAAVDTRVGDTFLPVDVDFFL